MLPKHWLAATFRTSFANTAQSVQSACWPVTVTREKQTKLDDDWKYYHGKKMSCCCHKAKSWENKRNPLRNIPSLTPPPPMSWIIYLLSNLQKSPKDKNLWFLKSDSTALWQLPRCGIKTTYKIALQVELQVAIWKISNLFKCIKGNKWAQPWSSSQLKCHEQHHLHSASPWAQRNVMLNCFTDPRMDRLTGSLLRSQVWKYQS